MRSRSAAAAAALLAAAALATGAGIVLLYLRAEVLSPPRFADRVAESVRTAPVREALAETLTEDLIERAQPELVVARPLVESVVAGVIGSASFRPLIRAAASELYGGLGSGEVDRVVLGLSDAAVVAIEALRRLQPSLAELIPPEAEEAAAELGDGGVTADALARADALRPLGLAVPALAAALLAAGVLCAPARRRAAGWAGLAVAAGAALAAVLPSLGLTVVVARAPAGYGDVAGAVWEAFLGDLTAWAMPVVAAGLVVWLTALGRLRAEALAAAAAEARDWALAPPGSGREAAVRGGLLLGLATAMITAWQPLLRLAAVAVAVLVAVRGLDLLLHAIAPRRVREAAAPPDAPALSASIRRLAAPTLAAAAAAGAGAGIFLGVRGEPSYGPRAVIACNGSPALCERPVNEVVFAATHNSMAAADEPGWFRAEQLRGIPDQLRSGIRGLLIDTWYGAAGPRGVATDFARSGIDRAELVREYGADAVAAVERLRGRLGFGRRLGGASTGLHLCHVACEAGATELERALGDIRSFLRDNPGEVLIIVIQDQITPEDTRRAFVRSGLREHVLAPPVDGTWPTLGEMIESGERVVVMSEERTSPDIPWLMPAFQVMEETPYGFSSPREMSCRPNRGGTGRPFFQLNHWIEEVLPSPSTAGRLNRFDFLMDRIRRCEAERGRLPSLVAVNFSERGDLLRAVDELNSTRGD